MKYAIWTLSRHGLPEVTTYTDLDFESPEEARAVFQADYPNIRITAILPVADEEKDEDAEETTPALGNA